MSAARYPTDYEVWAQYWDLIESHGVNVTAIPVLGPLLRGPILLIGSGQGLVAQSLVEAGFDVVAVDNSPAMARLALERRGLRTLVCDVVDLRLDERFGTILVNTGVVNGRSVDAGIVPRLATSLRPLLEPDAHLLIGYFRTSVWTHVAETLGLYGSPSTNELFWTSEGDLARAEHLFAVRSGRPFAVHRAFERHRVELARHAEFILRVGERCSTLREAPAAFLRQHGGFYPFPLEPRSESELARSLLRAGLVRCADQVLNGGDTRVIALHADAT